MFPCVGTAFPGVFWWEISNIARTQVFTYSKNHSGMQPSVVVASASEQGCAPWEGATSKKTFMQDLTTYSWDNPYLRFQRTLEHKLRSVAISVYKHYP